MSQKRRVRSQSMPRLAAVAFLLVLLLAVPRPAGAASTGSSSLFTPQASGSGTANGDYRSASAPGMIYRYFIEVPPSLGRLRIQIFDADFGAGGTGEAAAGRDRDRLGFNSAVSYSLVDPSGATRTVRF